MRPIAALSIIMQSQFVFFSRWSRRKWFGKKIDYFLTSSQDTKEYQALRSENAYNL